MVHKIFIIDVNETETTYIVKDIKLNTNIREKYFHFYRSCRAPISSTYANVHADRLMIKKNILRIAFSFRSPHFSCILQFGE